MEKAELRPLVLEALRRNPRTQYATVENFVRDRVEGYPAQEDTLTLAEILWDLLIQGVLAPGLDGSNTRFPFIHVTEYGLRCLEADAILPHDPDAYLQRLQQETGQPLDDIVLTHVRESLLTFLGGHFLAAAVMLGVASERCVDLLIAAYANAITDASRKANFERKVRRAGRSVKRRFDALRNDLLALALPSDLQDALDIQLSGIFTLIRYSRNDAGHPTGTPVDRDTAHANLLIFRQYCKRVYALLDYFGTHSV